ncbi:MAG: nitroreductase family protein [Candidatus Aminicenantes bacterium]|nr:nitroreductase family protein [Candidatus Aminicenantes bacterium]
MTESVLDIILSRRTIRRFEQRPVDRSILQDVIEAGRLAPSAANLQPLEFVLVDSRAVARRIFPCLRWAAAIAPRGDPRPGQKPAAYVVTLVNLSVREKGFEYDVGAAMENMILAARGAGLGTCWLLSIEREKIAEILGVPSSRWIDCVLALGYPAESPVAEEMTDSFKYWQDEKGVLHVPKRPVRSVCHFNRFG